MSIYGNPVMMGGSGGGGGGTEDVSIYGDLFKYCLLSTDSTDQFNRADRWFKRNSSEPIIVLGSAFIQSGSLVYTGYAVISFTGTAVTGTYSSYGDLSTPPRTATTPLGTTFYIQQMNGMYPPSSESNKIKLQFGTNSNNTQNVLEFVINDTKLIHIASTSRIVGDDDIVSALYNLIDSIAGNRGVIPSSLIQYLESSGTQYIDTGLIINSDTNVSVTFWNFSLTNTFLFGARGDSGIADDMYMVMCQSGSLFFDFGATREQIQPNPAAVGMHTIEIVNKVAYLDGVVKKTFTDTFTVDYSQILFGFHNGSNINISAKERIYHISYSKGGKLLRDFYPALDSNGVAGMWDAVTKQMYYNAGTGTFVVPT